MAMLFRNRYVPLTGSKVLTSGVNTSRYSPIVVPNPYPDHDYEFANVIPLEAIPSAQSDFPVPMQFTIPSLSTALVESVYNPYEVINLPLTGHITDLSFGTAKAAPETAHSVTLAGNAYVDVDGLHLDGNGDYGDISTLYTSPDMTFGENDFLLRFSYYVAVDGEYCILYKGSDSSNLLFVYLTDDNKLYFYFKTGGSVKGSYTTQSAVSLVGKHTAIFRRVGAGATLTVDGESVALTETVAFGTNSIAAINADLLIGTYAGSSNFFNGVISDVLILKGTSTAPASNYSHALQDLRIAKGSTELPYSAPLCGLNPITGVCDVWIKPSSLSSAADNTFTVYVGDNTAAAPTVGVTWPEEWPADPTVATWPDDWSEAELTEDQDTILDNLVDSPETYNETGALEENT